MTSKQQAIWHFMRKHTARLLMLQDIAEWVHCSTSTVSRFLHRLERWHFIQLIVLRGPGGGVAAITAKSHLNPLKVVRDSMRIHRTKIAQMRKAFDEIMRVKPETPSTPKVVVRVQLLLENWGFGIGG
jgi:DNA-binding IscR family transcriptional regulator